MLPLISSAFSLLGSAVSGLFQFKQGQTDIVKQAIAVLGDVNATAAQRDAATAAMLTQNGGGGWFANNVRPMVFFMFAGLIVARFFGFESSHMTPADQEMVNTIVMIYMGYFPLARTLDKIVTGIVGSNMLKTIIQKKIL